MLSNICSWGSTTSYTFILLFALSGLTEPVKINTDKNYHPYTEKRMEFAKVNRSLVGVGSVQSSKSNQPLETTALTVTKLARKERATLDLHLNSGLKPLRAIWGVI